MSKFFASTLFLIIPLTLSGCSLFGSAGGDQRPDPSVEERALIEAHAAPEAPKQGIEFTWEVPSESVDGFIIRYGSSPNSLSKEITISATDIREEKDPEHGPVYRYLVRDVEGNGPLFWSIAAVTGQSISNFSDVLEVKAEPGTSSRSSPTR
jgi:hypothetical protein